MNQNGIPNQMLLRYQESQRNNVPFQNNSLLQQNPMFRDNMNYNGSQQMQMMQMMHAKRLQEMKEIQKIKQIEKLNQLENTYDKEKIRESVIKPLKIDKRENVDDIIKNAKEKWGFDIKKERNNKNPYEQMEKQIKDNMDGQRVNLQKERTNVPYKNIIKNIKDGDQHYEKHYKKFVDKPLSGNADKSQIQRTEKELLVHKVTNADKEGVEEELVDLENKLEKHNNELKVIYSISEEAQHKKKFEYNHKSKYRIKYDPDDHDEMKKDKIKILKKEQKKLEKDKEKIDDIFGFLENEGVFNESNNESSESNKAPVKIIKPETKTKTKTNVPIKPEANVSKVSVPVKIIKPETKTVNTPVKIIKPETKKVNTPVKIIKPETKVSKVNVPVKIIKPSTTHSNNAPVKIHKPTNPNHLSKAPVKIVKPNPVIKKPKK